MNLLEPSFVANPIKRITGVLAKNHHLLFVRHRSLPIIKHP